MEKFREDVFGEDVRVYGGDKLDEFHLGHEVSEMFLVVIKNKNKR